MLLFLITLQRCHQCKAHGENLTKILTKSVHHGWAAKKVLILSASKTPILSFLGYINSIKNKLREEKHNQSVVSYLSKNMALQLIYRVRKLISLVICRGQQ